MMISCEGDQASHATVPFGFSSLVAVWVAWPKHTMRRCSWLWPCGCLSKTWTVVVNRPVPQVDVWCENSHGRQPWPRVLQPGKRSLAVRGSAALDKVIEGLKATASSDPEAIEHDKAKYKDRHHDNVRSALYKPLWEYLRMATEARYEAICRKVVCMGCRSRNLTRSSTLFSVNSRRRPLRSLEMSVTAHLVRQGGAYLCAHTNSSKNLLAARKAELTIQLLFVMFMFVSTHQEQRPHLATSDYVFVSSTSKPEDL